MATMLCRPAGVAAWLAAAAGVSGGCHVTQRIEDTRVGRTSLVTHRDRARPLPATVIATADGRLRFVEPLSCPADLMAELETTETVHLKPNLAIFVVGVLATSLGGVALYLGLSDDHPRGAPLTYAGVAAIATGVPFIVAPWFGNRTDEVDRGARTVKRGSRDEPCGARAVAGRSATLSFGGRRAVGAVDGDGYFAVSPYQLVDAYGLGTVHGVDVVAAIETASGTRTVRAVIESSALAAGRQPFFTRSGIDGRVERLEKVPVLEPGPMRVTRVRVDGWPALRLVLPIGNTGPGDAWGVRGRISATDPELDGRIIYMGRVPARSTVTGGAVILLSEAAERALEDGTNLAVQLLDAHAAAPAVPVRFRGSVPAEAP